MKYVEYLDMQSHLESLYDFHPEFFDVLNEDERQTLRAGFLYDVADNAYPESIKSFYEDTIAGNLEMQRKMLEAAQAVYTLSRSGDLHEDT